MFPARPAGAADVRLVTTIAASVRQSVGADALLSYTVAVRALGGVAYGISVEAFVGSPATWIGPPGGCATDLDGARLRCELGDVPDSARLGLAARVPATQTTPAPLTVTIVIGGSNVPTESLSGSGAPLDSATPTPTATAQPEPPALGAVPQSPAITPSPPRATSRTPATSPPRATSRTSATPPSRTPAPSGTPSRRPFAASHPAAARPSTCPSVPPAARPPGRPSIPGPGPAAPRATPPRPATGHATRHPHRRSAASRVQRHPAAPAPSAARPPVASVPPFAPPAPKRHPTSTRIPADAAPAPAPSVAPPSVAPPAVPTAPVAPPPPAAAPLPVPPPSVAPDSGGSPDEPPSDLSLVLPSVGSGSPPGPSPQASKDPNVMDPPQMSIVQADPVAGSRRAWVTVLGVTIVFETAVLWLAACLSLWRRRMALTQAASDASDGLTGRVRSIRRALMERIARLPRALAGLRR